MKSTSEVFIVKKQISKDEKLTFLLKTKLSCNCYQYFKSKNKYIHLCITFLTQDLKLGNQKDNNNNK